MVRMVRRIARAMLASVVAAIVLGPACYLKADSSRILRASHVIVEVGYVTDAMPESTPAANPWPILRRHLERIFQRTSPSIELRVPVLIADAPAQVLGPTFSMSDATDLARRERKEQSSGDTEVFYVLFLPGAFDVPPDNKRRVLVGDTAVDEAITVLSKTGMIREPLWSGYPVPNGVIVEQMFMAHEIAHGVGLVGDGLPMVQDHQSSEEGGHCAVPGCLMAADLSFASGLERVVADPSDVLYCDKCLADVDHMALSASSN